MSDSPSRNDRQPDDVLLVEEPTLADTDEPQGERGRIGYGKHERTSSWMLGVALILLVLAMGAWQWWSGRDSGSDDGSTASSINAASVGEPAPDFTLKTLEGEDFTLSEQQGKVVVLNFWGSWCEPCREEMPAFQRYWESAPDDVLFVGVSAKQDSDENAQKFVDEFGVTYPIVRDIGGKRVTQGQVSLDYKIAFYPMTYFISPDGTVSSLVVSTLNEDDLQKYIDKARDDAAIVIPFDSVAIWRRDV